MVDKSSTTTKYGCTITTVAPENNQIEAVTRTGAAINITVVTTPIAWRWPIVGESWMARQENGAWYLDGPWPDPNSTAAVTLFGITPGDAIINSPTGVVHVIGSSDGSTDFSFALVDFPHPTRGTATLASGAVVVTTAAITAVSRIQLTAQDNNTTGALRISARTPGTNFTITSSNGADHGLVAYEIIG
jgi:hypothetical protein